VACICHFRIIIDNPKNSILAKNLNQMTDQNFTNHRRYVKGYHYLLSSMLLIGTIISIVNAVRHPPNSGGFVSSLLIVLLFVCGFFSSWFLRQFPIKAQDRAIRVEEGLRHYILTGKPLDTRLSIGQITALRFAPDDEFLQLIDKAIAGNLSSQDIKKSIKNWRGDYDRV
jgi:Family of unknown function (DUF6526)